MMRIEHPIIYAFSIAVLVAGSASADLIVKPIKKKPAVVLTGITPEEKATICSVSDPALIKSVKLNSQVEYFFRPFPKSNKIAISANNHNYFLDLDTMAKVELPGKFDPMPLPGEKMWIYPDGNSLHFRKLKQGSDAGDAFVDPSMTGYYQSAGKLRTKTGEEAYRVMINRKGGGYYFQDYAVTAQNEIAKVHVEPVQVCANVPDLQTQSLPMISKDGESVAFYSAFNKKTGIYHLSANGDCTLVRNLLFGTGKVDFSYDGKSVAYHTVSNPGDAQPDSSQWFSQPASDTVANVWTTNIETGVTKQISHFTSKSALYPSYQQNGNLMVRGYLEGGSAILTYNPDLERRTIDSKMFDLGASCSDPAKVAKYSLLGYLFSAACLDASNTATDALHVLSLDKESCAKLANAWDRNKDAVVKALLEGKTSGLDAIQVARITQKELLSICPREVAQGPKNVVVNRVKQDVNLGRMPKALSGCIACHQNGNSTLPISFNNIVEFKAQLTKPSKLNPAISLLESMRTRILNRVVPPEGDKLNNDQTNESIDWLDAFKANQLNEQAQKKPALPLSGSR